MGYADEDKYGMLKDTLWESSVGKIIGPINIEGYSGIFKVLGKRNGEIKKFNSVKEEAKQDYIRYNSRAIMDSYIEKLKKHIPIKVNGDLLASMKL